MSSARPRSATAARDADRWFREQGLPTFVPLHRWFTDLPRRVAPLVVWAAIVVYPLGQGIDLTVDLVEKASIGTAPFLAAVVIALVLGGLALTWGVYLLVRLLLRRLSVGIGTLVALGLIAACIAGIISDGFERSPRATIGPVAVGILVLAVCVLVTGMGGGALISWASRLAVRNASAIGHMASIALPVILMLVVFAFFSAEVWQMASALHWGSIALVALVVAVLEGIVVLRVSAAEIDDHGHAPTEEQRRAMLAGTPAEERGVTAVTAQPLRAPQRINILLALTVAQLLQALFFSLLLASLLIVIGGIAIPVGVIEIWVGSGSASQPLAVEHLRIAGVTLPITVNLLKAAMLLAVIATLPFVFSAVSETRYRERFFDPIMADMRRAILVRDTLRTPVSRAPRAPRTSGSA